VRGDVSRAIHGQDAMAPIWQQYARGRRGVSKFQPARGQIPGQCGIGGRRDEQHESRRHHVMDKAGRSDFFAADAAADPIVPLENQNALALFAKQRRRHQRVDAAADNDIVEVHGALPTRFDPKSLKGSRRRQMR
jgi:hypothetical protein